MFLSRDISSQLGRLKLLELRPILPVVTPLALLALWLSFPAVTLNNDMTPPPTNGKAPREPLASARWPAAGLARSFISCNFKLSVTLKICIPKIRKQEPNHENADANITCNVGDRDISRLEVAYLTHAIRDTRYIATSIIVRSHFN